MKKCSRCKIEKSKNEFYIKSKEKGVLRSECISCGNQKQKTIRTCYRCKIEFKGTLKKQFCSKDCQNSAYSERMKFEYDLGKRGAHWY